MEKLYVAKLMYHKWEEEPISGVKRGYKGTFAIFFYGCNLHCVYCQNSAISRIKVGDLKDKKNCVFSADELSDKIVEAEKNGAASISFITGVWYIDLIADTIKLAKEKGLTIPVVYNSSAYEMERHVKKLDGLIDIYLPDFKYYDDALGKKYSGISNYFDIAKECIATMYRQVGKCNFDIDGNVESKARGVIVRHLILPSHTEDSKRILRYLYDTYGNKIFYSIMSQYTPILKNKELNGFSELHRKLSKREYDKVVSYAIDIGITNAWTQDMEVASESFIPEFM